MTAPQVMVTGASGFVGTALVARLRALERDVIESHHTEYGLAQSAIDMPAGSHIFHLAAKTFIPDSWTDPASFYRVNLQGTLEILEECRKARFGLTFVSSYIYGRPTRLPVDEDHPLRPNNPYSHSKKLAEDACRFYAEHFGLSVTILRPFNIYGPGQRGDFLIPTIVRQVLDPAIAVVEVADLEPRRDLLFLDDVIDALVNSLSHPSGGTYNVGSGVSVSVADVIRTAAAYAGIDKPMRARGQRRPDEILDLYADISRIRTDLGWTPRISLAQGIGRVIDASRPIIPPGETGSGSR